MHKLFLHMLGLRIALQDWAPGHSVPEFMAVSAFTFLQHITVCHTMVDRSFAKVGTESAAHVLDALAGALALAAGDGSERHY